jgi:hypothetical protein
MIHHSFSGRRPVAVTNWFQKNFPHNIHNSTRRFSAQVLLLSDEQKPGEIHSHPWSGLRLFSCRYCSDSKKAPVKPGKRK